MEIQDTSAKKEYSKPLWVHPWKYRESLIIALLTIIGGIALGVLARGRVVKPIGVPYNIYVAFAFVFMLLFLQLNYRKRPFVIWLSSVPGAFTAISLFAIMILLLGFLPQGVEYNSKFIWLFGLSHIKTSWLFLVTQCFFLTTLGMVTLRRCFPLNGRNLGFFLNHFGLFLTLSAAILGSGDIKRLEINLLKEGVASNIGVSGEGEMFKLPFSLRLLNFTIDEYNPRIAIIDPHSGLYKTPKGKSLPMVEPGLKANLEKWQIQVLSYLPHALLVDSLLQNSTDQGSFPAANVKAINITRKDTVKGWISSGSYLQSPMYLSLDTGNVLVLTIPEVRKYTSVVEVRTDSLKVDTISLEVNKPFSVYGWKIYQVNYDQSKGKWSSLSVLEAISDPWLKLVYTGIFMMMVGVVYLFWIGAKSRDVTNF